MSALLHVRVHFIWSMYNREPRIDPARQDELCRFIHGICENIRCNLILAGGVGDHLHSYLALPATISIAEVVNALKSNSSRWIHERFDPGFAWQTKYGAFSVSKSMEDPLLAYIRSQAEHHGRQSFRDELVAFLKRHEVEYDPRYFLE